MFWNKKKNVTLLPIETREKYVSDKLALAKREKALKQKEAELNEMQGTGSSGFWGMLKKTSSGIVKAQEKVAKYEKWRNRNKPRRGDDNVFGGFNTEFRL